jgi:hypothetical protein
MTWRNTDLLRVMHDATEMARPFVVKQALKEEAWSSYKNKASLFAHS